ncbi:MAG: O-antigen polymerase [Vicinamibacterales bacterium]|jgi:hypothetical protein
MQPNAGIDWLSPPSLLAAAYVVGFGFSVVDGLVEGANPSLIGYRLRWVFDYDTGLSLGALLYLLLGYALFLLGYRLRLAAIVAPARNVQNRAMATRLASAVTTIAFIATFGTLVAYTASVGYGRYVALDDTGQSGLENLSLLGELSILPFSLGMYRFAIWRRTKGAAYMSLFDRAFTWAIMLPLQVGLSVFIGSRSRALTMVLVTVGAFHYGYRRLTARLILVLIAFCVLVVLPGISILRLDADNRPKLEPSLLWENMMERGSSLESFTVIFANLNAAPTPDPLWLTVATGLVPRAIWSEKPMATTASRFSDWASGRRTVGLSPPLPGELLLHFGYVGGLVAMFALGLVWRLIFIRWGPSCERASADSRGFLYIALMPTFLSLDAGFVNPYSVLIRFLVVGVPMLIVCQKPAYLEARAPASRRGRTSRRSVPQPASSRKTWRVE